MTQRIESLLEIAERFSALVFDQWGVLHQGHTAYPRAIETLERLRSLGVPMAVLSNSGKRAAPNLRRIADLGFDPSLFQAVMTSGEALWRDLRSRQMAGLECFAVERTPGDARRWAEGLTLSFTPSPEDAQVLLLMGVPDGAHLADFETLLTQRFEALICSNPDRRSPRGDDLSVMSPGALAHRFEEQGHDVTYYGKPHVAVFESVARDLHVPLTQILMVGDSLEHDIAGGAAAGCATALVCGGLYAHHFSNGGDLGTLTRAFDVEPDFLIDTLQ